MSDKKKKKKEKGKIKYIDDGRTIVDMSAVSRYGRSSTGKDNLLRPQSTFKDKWKTYWSAVRSMILPMIITLVIITIGFFLLYVFLGGFSQP